MATPAVNPDLREFGVSREIVSTVLRAQGKDVRPRQAMDLLFVYHQSRPYSVRVRFPKTVWEFSRDLLQLGCLTETDHEADVVIEPYGIGELAISLQPNGAVKEFQVAVSLPQVRSFLHASCLPPYGVPMGRESDYLDIDLQLACLLRP